MKLLIARLAIALALVAFAVPALACDAHKTTTTASKQEAKPAISSTAAKAEKTTTKAATAKVTAPKPVAQN